MDYITIKEAAEKWGVSLRSVQAYCTEGKISGATKFGGSWAIPSDCEKPSDLRRKSNNAKAADAANVYTESFYIPMPLINTAFEPGGCLDAVEQITDPDLHNIALAEYYYFSGQSKKASKITEKYLGSNNLGLRLSACWIYAYANLAMDNIDMARRAMAGVKEMISSLTHQTPPELKTMIMFVSTGASVLLHLPLEYEMPSMNEFIVTLPPGLRLFALYIYAHYAYLQKDYGASVGIAETALALEQKIYPIPTIYLHLAAVMDYMCLKRPEEAKKHVIAAWELAHRDGLIEAFGEHHGLLGGMLEATIKKLYPEEFKRIISITYKFSAGWRKIHNTDTGNSVADTLTTTEFAVSMLASKDYSNKEIAAVLGISENTVKHHITNAIQELHVSDRKELKRFMLS